MLAIAADPESLAARALNHLGVTHNIIVEYLSHTIGPVDHTSPQNPRITPRFDEVINAATIMADQHGRSYADTRHIVVQLIRNPHTVMAHFFNQLNITEEIFTSTADMMNPSQ